MKRFSLLPLVALVFAVGYACTDATAPANSHSLLTPNGAALDKLGDPPPPPVDAAITFTISSHTFTGAFNGVYFSNGTTAWLRLDNRQPDAFETTASRNARFMRQDDKLFGMGTLVIDGREVVITEVTRFDPNSDCGTSGEVCAFITFNATVDGQSGHTGTAEAFDRETCTFVPPDGEGSGGFFDCGEGGID